ncbi:protein kinase family protein [Rhynchospora pubera]|uniref:Protein kinase family protein n=1 Tax=Rhynchospora pubera TaxID=906938 RepID=A0AAV8ASJ6_9POAL|nr:protein kinase family protein [Rhynchospora pubera]KAJ4781947.1 protein kinase family protein [Rhynchospora pubera]
MDNNHRFGFNGFVPRRGPAGGSSNLHNSYPYNPNKFSLDFSNPNGLGNRNTITSDPKSNTYDAHQQNILAKGMKRKWVDFSLGLPQSSASSDSTTRPSSMCTHSSSGKENEGESPMDLGINFELSLVNENHLAPKAANEPMLELELSLSVGRTESVVTDAPATAVTYHTAYNTISVPDILSVPTVDEGSTSSRWKGGNNMLPYLQEKSILFPQPIAGTSQGVVVPGEIHNSPTNRPNYRTGNNPKTCQHPGCAKGARGASGKCIAHGGGRRCQKDGCTKGAEGRTIFCKAHGGGRRCEFLGCTKSAEGRTEFCIAHGGGRRCNNDGCTRAARGKSGLCIRHGGGKRCTHPSCTKSAEGHTGLCIAHGGGRRCQYPQCSKGAQGSTNFCKAHGGGKRCTYEGCTKGAEGSTPYCKGHGGGKRCSFPAGCTKSVHGGTQFCVAHGGGKRCAMAECTKSARGRTDYCVRHGGGKRCKVDGCDKSAQGSTDYCKAHGGGKRCAWGQVGTGLGEPGAPCDRFARGKVGLCAAHTALLDDTRVHGGQSVGSVVSGGSHMTGSVGMVEMRDVRVRGSNTGVRFFSHSGIGGVSAGTSHVGESSSQPIVAPAPERRVHGGSLLSLLGAELSPQEKTGGHDGKVHGGVPSGFLSLHMG